jgi:hypothetical protein
MRIERTTVKVLGRIWGVLKGDEDVFFEIGLDGKASWTAFGLVCVIGLISGLGWILRSGNPYLSIVSTLLVAAGTWWIFGYTISFVETLVGGGGVTRSELLRLTAFSAIPLILLSVPHVGWFSVAWFWGLMYRALRSFYSTKPRHTVFLLLTGSFVAFIFGGLAFVLINTAWLGRASP